MIPKQKVIYMLFDDIEKYQSKSNLDKNSKEEILQNINKAEALIEFAKKLNKL